MKIIADLHLHSKYSRAVSKQMEPEIMVEWAVKKGIDLLATGDWTHPLWLKELESTLEEASDGIFKLKSITNHQSPITKFLLSTEISSIYSQGGKGRRIHNLVLAPSFKTVHKINDELKRRGGNLMSDGRPIIGLSSIQLAELVWTIDEDCLIIPAHIWTPYFAMFGSKSGFDSVEECWGKFADRIYAIETGLSSDPAMNWRIKELENRSVVSFGDAHSPAKIGREATVFELSELNYQNIANSLCSRAKDVDLLRSTDSKFFSSETRSKKPQSFHQVKGETLSTKKKNLEQSLRKSSNNETMKQCNNRILYTIEFHPEEGKYHYTGHRNCKIRQSPEETKKKGAICPVCGKPLTLGVMHRVEELASREELELVKKTNNAGLTGYYNKLDKSRPPYVMLVPLMEILSESIGVGVGSKRVQNEYENLTKNLGSEIEILTQTKLEKIESLGGSKVAKAVKKARKGDIIIEPGFDGVFGIVKVWPLTKSDQEKAVKLKPEKQISLF